MKEESRRDFLKKGIGLAALAAVGPNRADAGHVSRDAETGSRGEITFSNSKSQLNRPIENWVDTFLLRDRLFLDQTKAVAKTGRTAELKYDIHKKEDGDLYRRSYDAVGALAALYKLADCYVLIQSSSSNIPKILVGLMENSGKKTPVLSFSIQVDRK